MTDFDDSQSIGAMPPNLIADYLEEGGDQEGAAMLRNMNVTGQSLKPFSRPHILTGVKVGFVASENDATHLNIVSANSIRADDALVHQRIKITLDRFYVHVFPGFGLHQILCEFAGRNQCQGTAEEIVFALTIAARDRSGGAITGVPIFVGLEVSPDGLAFRGKVVNVRNSADDWLLEALGGDTFRSGLSLIATAQPVLKPFVKLAADAVQSTLKRGQNKQVSAFDLGLDFSKSSTSAKLRFGSYVIVQGDSGAWVWNDLVLVRETNTLQHRGSGEPLGQNYLILGVSPAFTKIT